MVHLNTEQAHEELVNSWRACVFVSRGRYDAQAASAQARAVGVPPRFFPITCGVQMFIHANAR